MCFFPSLRLAALSIWLSHIQSVLVLQSHRNLRFPPSQFQNRAKTSEALRIASCFLTVQVCFLGAFRKWHHNQRTIALSLEHKFVMADAKNLHFQAQYVAVFILEDALSVQTDNASMAVFILRMHYPSGRTWANICSSSGYESQV